MLIGAVRRNSGAPGAPISLRGLAILRQRERDENASEG